MADAAALPPGELLLLPDVAAWRAWLEDNDAAHDGVWLVLAKKGTTTPTSLSYAQALEEALCSGWIDGQKRSRDAGTMLQRFTPRRKASLWSQRNVGLVAELVAAGRMRDRGRSEVERAQGDGRWDRAYAGARTAEVPDDLAAALAASPEAAAMFETLNGANRYAVLHRVTTATPTARAARVERLVAMLARGQTPHPQ